MPAKSFDDETGSEITVYFEHSALGGLGPEFEGAPLPRLTLDGASRGVGRADWATIVRAILERTAADVRSRAPAR